MRGWIFASILVFTLFGLGVQIFAETAGEKIIIRFSRGDASYPTDMVNFNARSRLGGLQITAVGNGAYVENSAWRASAPVSHFLIERSVGTGKSQYYNVAGNLLPNVSDEMDTLVKTLTTGPDPGKRITTEFFRNIEKQPFFSLSTQLFAAVNEYEGRSVPLGALKKFENFAISSQSQGMLIERGFTYKLYFIRKKDTATGGNTTVGTDVVELKVESTYTVLESQIIKAMRALKMIGDADPPDQELLRYASLVFVLSDKNWDTRAASINEEAMKVVATQYNDIKEGDTVKSESPVRKILPELFKNPDFSEGVENETRAKLQLGLGLFESNGVVGGAFGSTVSLLANRQDLGNDAIYFRTYLRFLAQKKMPALASAALTGYDFYPNSKRQTLQDFSKPGQGQGSLQTELAVKAMAYLFGPMKLFGKGLTANTLNQIDVGQVTTSLAAFYNNYYNAAGGQGLTLSMPETLMEGAGNDPLEVATNVNSTNRFKFFKISPLDATTLTPTTFNFAQNTSSIQILQSPNLVKIAPLDQTRTTTALVDQSLSTKIVPSSQGQLVTGVVTFTQNQTVQAIRVFSPSLIQLQGASTNHEATDAESLINQVKYVVFQGTVAPNSGLAICQLDRKGLSNPDIWDLVKSLLKTRSSGFVYFILDKPITAQSITVSSLDPIGDCAIYADNPLAYLCADPKKVSSVATGFDPSKIILNIDLFNALVKGDTAGALTNLDPVTKTNLEVVKTQFFNLTSNSSGNLLDSFTLPVSSDLWPTTIYLDIPTADNQGILADFLLYSLSSSGGGELFSLPSSVVSVPGYFKQNISLGVSSVPDLRIDYQPMPYSANGVDTPATFNAKYLLADLFYLQNGLPLSELVNRTALTEMDIVKVKKQSHAIGLDAFQLDSSFAYRTKPSETDLRPFTWSAEGLNVYPFTIFPVLPAVASLPIANSPVADDKRLGSNAVNLYLGSIAQVFRTYPEVFKRDGSDWQAFPARSTTTPNKVRSFGSFAETPVAKYESVFTKQDTLSKTSFNLNTYADLITNCIPILDASSLAVGDILVGNDQDKLGIIVALDYIDPAKTLAENRDKVVVVSISRTTGAANIGYWGRPAGSQNLVTFTTTPDDYTPMRLVLWNNLGSYVATNQPFQIWDLSRTNPVRDSKIFQVEALARSNYAPDPNGNKNGWERWIPNTHEALEIGKIIAKTGDQSRTGEDLVKLSYDNPLGLNAYIENASDYAYNRIPAAESYGNVYNNFTSKFYLISLHKKEGIEKGIPSKIVGDKVVRAGEEIGVVAATFSFSQSSGEFSDVQVNGQMTVEVGGKKYSRLRLLGGVLVYVREFETAGADVRYKTKDDEWAVLAEGPTANSCGNPGDDILLRFRVSSGTDSYSLSMADNMYLRVYDKKMLWRANLYINEVKQDPNPTPNDFGDWNTLHPWNAPPNQAAISTSANWSGWEPSWGYNDWNRIDRGTQYQESKDQFPVGDGGQVVDIAMWTRYNGDLISSVNQKVNYFYRADLSTRVENVVPYAAGGSDDPFSTNKKLYSQMYFNFKNPSGWGTWAAGDNWLNYSPDIRYSLFVDDKYWNTLKFGSVDSRNQQLFKIVQATIGVKNFTLKSVDEIIFNKELYAYFFASFLIDVAPFSSVIANLPVAAKTELVSKYQYFMFMESMLFSKRFVTSADKDMVGGRSANIPNVGSKTVYPYRPNYSAIERFNNYAFTVDTSKNKIDFTLEKQDWQYFQSAASIGVDCNGFLGRVGVYDGNNYLYSVGYNDTAVFWDGSGGGQGQDIATLTNAYSWTIFDDEKMAEDDLFNHSTPENADLLCPGDIITVDGSKFGDPWPHCTMIQNVFSTDGRQITTDNILFIEAASGWHDGTGPVGGLPSIQNNGDHWRHYKVMKEPYNTYRNLDFAGSNEHWFKFEYHFCRLKTVK